MSVLIDALQAMPLPYEGFGEYLVRTVANSVSLATFGETMQQMDQVDPEGETLSVYDIDAYGAALVLKSAHEWTQRNKSRPPQAEWHEIARATKVLLVKTQDATWLKAYREACWATV